MGSTHHLAVTSSAEQRTLSHDARAHVLPSCHCACVQVRASAVGPGGAARGRPQRRARKRRASAARALAAVLPRVCWHGRGQSVTAVRNQAFCLVLPPLPACTLHLHTLLTCEAWLWHCFCTPGAKSRAAHRWKHPSAAHDGAHSVCRRMPRYASCGLLIAACRWRSWPALLAAPLGDCRALRDSTCAPCTTFKTFLADAALVACSSATAHSKICSNVIHIVLCAGARNRAPSTRSLAGLPPPASTSGRRSKSTAPPPF